jgi:hypothetical protein
MYPEKSGEVRGPEGEGFWTVRNRTQSQQKRAESKQEAEPFHGRTPFPNPFSLFGKILVRFGAVWCGLVRFSAV